jgi:hypothetical protein
VAHIALGDLGRENYLAAPTDTASRAACTQAIRQRLARARRGFRRAAGVHAAGVVPLVQQGSARFVSGCRTGASTLASTRWASRRENPVVVN